MARSGKTLPHFHTGRPVVVVALDHRCPRHRIVPFQGPVLCHQMITDRQKAHPRLLSSHWEDWNWPKTCDILPGEPFDFQLYISNPFLFLRLPTGGGK